jgi:hypothetical protein
MAEKFVDRLNTGESATGPKDIVDGISTINTKKL